MRSRPCPATVGAAKLQSGLHTRSAGIPATGRILVAAMQGHRKYATPGMVACVAFFILPTVALLGLIPSVLAQSGQTITFNALAGKTFGAAPFPVSATASSGLPVSFASLTSPVCTVSVATVTVVAAGTCTVQASQPGNATYAAAPNVSQSFAVAKAAQTITFAALAAKTYGAVPFTVTATASSALPVSFVSTTTTVCTVAGSTVTIVTGGTCTIQARQAGNGNYNAATSVNQGFVVTKAAQTIAFGALGSRTYGNPPFAVSATASSGLAVTFSSSTAGVCTVSGSTVTIVSGGTCTINAAQAGNTSYLAATTVGQSFAVGKAGQTITFGVLANQTYGVAPFALSATASSGLAVTFTSTATTVCTVSGGTVTIRTGGTCTINAAQAGNASYVAATTVSRSFTVAKANQTITFGVLANQTYGVSPFPVSAIASSALATTFSSLTTTICTVSGSTVTIRAGGTCTIQAAQPGNTSYNAAPNVSQSFTVATATQTITFGALSSKTYGAAPFTVSATASSSLAVSFSSLTTPVCTVSGSTVTLVSAGICTIQAAQPGNGNYSAAPNVSQGFTVAKANQTITFASPGSQAITSSPIPISASASSGLAVAFSSLTTQSCTVSGTAVTLLRSGTCTIQATQAGNASYAPAPSVTQSFLVVAVPQFGSSVVYALGNFPNGIAAGDFNGDGRPDLAIPNAFSGTVSVFLGSASGTFTPTATVQLGGEPGAIVAGDFNGDGKVDLAVADMSRNVVIILMGNGGGGFANQGSFTSNLVPVSIAAADLNGDGKIDLVVANGTANGVTGQTISVLLGNGDATFRAPVSYVTGPSPNAVLIADFNGDGEPDIAAVNGDNNTLSILIGRGDGTFLPAVNYSTDSYPDEIAVGDFNGDGRLALAVVNDFSNDVSIFLGRGDGTFGTATNFAVGSGPSSVAVADFNGDGLTDLVIANRFDNTVALLLAEGDGTFRTPISYSIGGQLKAIIGKDLNGDGKPDIAVISAADNSLTVMLQTGTGGGGANQAPAFVSSTPPNGTVNLPYSFAVSATGTPSPTFAVTSGALPTGLSLNSASGAINGLPSIAGTFSGTLTASNGVAPAANQPFSIVIAAQASQTITFGALGNQVFGVPPFTISASASSGLPVSFASLTTSVCTVSGSTVTLVSVGTCTVRASQAGNAIYPPAVNADEPFSVGQGSQTIAFGSLSNQTYGAQPFPTIATSSSGLPVNLSSLTPSVCSITVGTITIISAGTCTIRASQPGNMGYRPAPNADQTFAIAQAAQTISFATIAGARLDAQVGLSAIASSGLPVAFASLTPATCTVSGNEATVIALGTCTIRASQAGNINYAAAPNADQNVGIQQVQQTLTFWPPATQVLGAQPFALSATASSGLPITFSSLTTATCTVSADMVTLVAAGTCTIRALQPGDSANASATLDRSFTISTVGSLPPPAPTGPFVEYAMHLGGGSSDQAFDVLVGPDGSAFVGGSIASTDFPGLSSAKFTNAGVDLMYVARVDPNGGVLNYTTVVGGRAPDVTDTGDLAFVGLLKDPATQYLGAGQVEAMAVDGMGNVYAAAYAYSTTFPQAGGSYLRNGSKYIFKIDPTGAVQTASAPIDASVQTIRAIAIDAAGAIYFTGVAGPGLATSATAAIRTMPAPTASNWTLTAPYLIKLTPGGGSIAFATYLSVPGSRANTGQASGQSSLDVATTAYALVVDSAGNSYLAGQATCDEFPVTAGSPDTTDTKNRDAFIAKMNPTGTALIFVARLGGSDAERGTGIALSPDGGIVMVGKTATQPFTTFSSAFQTTVVFQPGTLQADRETGFVAKLSADGTHWLAKAAIGSSGGNLVYQAFSAGTPSLPLKVAVDGSNAIYVAGSTDSSRTLPIVAGLQDVAPGGAFIMKIAPDATRLIYSTTLGGGVVTGLSVDSFGNVYLAGYGMTLLLNSATSFDDLLGSVFVAKLNDQAKPIVLTSDHNPAVSAQVITLNATMGDRRYVGAIEFDDGPQSLGVVPVSAGVATLPTTLPPGIHRVRAVFHGSGPFDGAAAVELIQVVNQ